MTPDFRKNRRKLALMKKQRILVVDDSALNRELLSEMLSDNYKICEAQKRAGSGGASGGSLAGIQSCPA